MGLLYIAGLVEIARETSGKLLLGSKRNRIFHRNVVCLLDEELLKITLEQVKDDISLWIAQDSKVSDILSLKLFCDNNFERRTI